MPQVAALIPAVLAVAGASSTVVAAATLAIGVALTVVSTLFAQKPNLPKPSDGQVNARQQNGPRWRWYGRVRAGGQMFFFDSKDGVLYVGVIFHHGTIDAFEGWWIDGVEASVTEISSSPQVLETDETRYVLYFGSSVEKPLVKIRPQDGSANVADAELISQFPSTWTSAHKLLGLANAVVTFRSVPAEYYTSYYPNGRPEVTAVMRAEAGIVDPRDSSTGWNDNAGLVIRDYLTHPDGMNIDTDLIDDDVFGAFADLCDEVVTTDAGSEARYRIWGGYPLDAEPATVLQRFLDACDARLYQTPAGQLGIRGGQYTAPTVTLGEDQILDANFRRGSDALARYNTLRFTYLEPALNYLEQEGDPWVDAGLLAANDSVEEQSSIDLEVVPSHPQARRLAKIRIARDNPEWIGEIRTTLAGMDAWTEEFITIQVPELEIDGPFRVDEMHVLGDGRGVMLTVSSVDPDSYDWTTAEEGTAPTGDVPTSDLPTLSAPTGVEALVRRSPLTGSDPSYTVTVMWDEPARIDLEHEVQHREAFTSSWESERAPNGQYEISGISAQAGDALDIRVRALTPNGIAGDWSTTLEFALDSTATTPGALTGVSATDISGGLTVDWTAGVDTVYVDIFLNDTNDFSSATRAHTKIAGSGAQSASFDWESGTWYVWVRAYGGLGDPTSEVSAGTVTIA